MSFENEIKSMMAGAATDEDLAALENEQQLQEAENVEEGEEEAEGSEGEGAAEGEAEEEEELTPEQRYNNLLQLYNQQAQENLELRSRVGVPQTPEQEEQQRQIVEQKVIPAAPTKFAIKQLRAQIDKALIEDDGDALEEIFDKVVGYVEQLADPQKLRETLLLDMPSVARSIADQRFTLLMAVKEFYDENEDLKPYMPVVGSIINHITAKEPQLSLAEVLAKTEQETRKQLGLKKRIQASDNAANRGKPSFAKSNNSRKPGAPKIEGVKEDIAAMMNAR